MTHHVVITAHPTVHGFFTAQCVCGWRTWPEPEDEVSKRAARHLTETEKEAA